MPGVESADTKDVWMCTTFANSAPLPLVFADSLFANNWLMKADVIACISFYILLWSPISWKVGPRMLETETQLAREAPPLDRDRYSRNVEYELDGSKNKCDTAN
jgi:predicted permease